MDGGLKSNQVRNIFRKESKETGVTKKKKRGRAIRWAIEEHKTKEKMGG